MRIRSLTLAVSLWAGVLAFGLSGRGSAMTQFSEKVVMSDGTGLATRVYLPDGSGGVWPTLLVRTPYTMKGSFGDQLLQGMELLTMLGYAIVVQDARGTGDSEGVAQPFLTDRADGMDTLAWILDQPWTDGRILMAGGSALGIPAYLVAPGAPEALQCQLLAIATPDVYAHGAFQGGVLRESDVKSWTSWLGLQSIVPQILEHRDCTPFWDPVRVTGLGADVRAAAVHVGGWYDLFLQGTLDGFTAWRQSTDSWASQHQYLVIGPWHHHAMGEAKVGEFELPDAAKWDLFASALSWVQWCFDGGNDAVDSWPPVRYWVMGAVGEPGAPGNEWREADDWPPFPTVDTAWHLAADGRLDWGDPGPDFEVAIPFDPADPSPTVGGRNLSGSQGPRDQSVKVESRPDVALFTTEPLSEPVEVTGRLSARIWAATDGPDADIAVRLTDVYPDGRSFLVVDGITRMSRREGCEHAVEVAPGVPVEVEVDLWSISWIFNAGHQIRVAVTGSNHPRFERNPEVTAPITIRVFGGAAFPSALWLPLPAPPVPEPEPETADEAGGLSEEPETDTGETAVPEEDEGGESADLADPMDAAEPGVDAPAEDGGLEGTSDAENSGIEPGRDVVEDEPRAEIVMVDDITVDPSQPSPEPIPPAPGTSGGCSAGASACPSFPVWMLVIATWRFRRGKGTGADKCRGGD